VDVDIVHVTIFSRPY